MYESLEALIRPLLKLPKGPPEMPRDGHTQVKVFRAARRFLVYRYLLSLLQWVPLALGLGVAVVAATVERSPWAGLLAVAGGVGLLVGAVVAYVLARLDWELRYYVVTDKSLRIREGAWTVKEMTLTYANVQNVAVEQGPLERWLGLANVTVDTAGGGGGRVQKPGEEPTHRGVLRGISNATEVRDTIRAWLGQVHRHSGLGDPEEEAVSSTPGASGLGAEHVAALNEVLAEVKALRAQVRSDRGEPAED